MNTELITNQKVYPHKANSNSLPQVYKHKANFSPVGVQTQKQMGSQKPDLNGTFHKAEKQLPASVQGVAKDQDFVREEPAIRTHHQGCEGEKKSTHTQKTAKFNDYKPVNRVETTCQQIKSSDQQQAHFDQWYMYYASRWQARYKQL